MDNRGMVGRGMVDNRGMVCRGMVDNRGNSNSVSNWVVDSMGHCVGNNSMVSYWVSNKTMVSNWVSNNSMVSNSSMWSKAAMGHNSTMSMADHLVGGHVRGRGRGSKAKKGGNNESLHFCPILFLQLPM